MLVKNCNLSDRGIYTLNISNKSGKDSSKCEVLVIFPPKIIKNLQNVEVIQKKTAILEAEIESIPNSTAEWFKNEILINPASIEYENRYSIIERKGGVHQLIIKNCKNEDSGLYRCKLSNKLGNVSSESKLKVIIAPFFIQKFDQVDGVENCDIRVTSILGGYPIPKITWFQNNNELDLSNNKKYESLIQEIENNYEVTLIIKNSKKSDAGQFQCVAENEAGRGNCFGKILIHPLTAPKFIVSMNKEKIIPENKPVELNVKVSGIPVPKISWYKDGTIINREDKTFNIIEDNRTGICSLISTNISKDHSGNYLVKATNPGGEVINSCNLIIKGFHPFFINKPEKLTCLEGNLAIIGCSFDGEPKPNANWSFKNKDLKTDSKTKITYDNISKSSILEIEKCSKSDEGTYVVTIKNVHGSESAIVSLVITEDESEVQDYKLFLKVAEQNKLEVEEIKPDWGKLKETEQIKKTHEEEENQIVLKKVELLPVFLVKPTNEKTEIGKETAFYVEIKSSSKCDIKWYNNGKELENKGNIKIEKDENRKKYILIVKRVSKENEGIIECVAINKDGESKESCKLNIIGKYF